MKRLGTLLIMLSVLMTADSAYSADSATVGVSATVTSVCKFSSGGSVNFVLDPTVGGNVAGTVSQPLFWCTKNTSYTITAGNGSFYSGGSRRMKHSTLAEYIPYSFNFTATGTGGGKTATTFMDITSTVLGADYTGASAGVYDDIVVVTINP